MTEGNSAFLTLSVNDHVLQSIAGGVFFQETKGQRIRLKGNDLRFWIKPFEIESCHADIRAAVKNYRVLFVAGKSITLAGKYLAIEQNHARPPQVLDIPTKQLAAANHRRAQTS